MDENVLATVVGLIIFFVSAAIITFLILKYRTDKSKWKNIAEDSYNRGKDEATQIIQSTCDQIEEDKAKLEGFSDRELLINIMLALGSYGRRIDRIDSKLKCITNYKAYIDDMNNQTQKMSQNFIILDGHIASTSAIIDSLKQTIQETSANIHKLIADLGSLAGLHTKINSHITNLAESQMILGQLQQSVGYIIEEMNAVLTTYDQAPMKKLKTIEVDVASVISTIALLKTSMGSIDGALNELSSATINIKETIYKSMQEHTYGSLFYRIAEIDDKLSILNDDINHVDSDLSNLKGNISNIDSSMDEMKSTVEDSLGRYSFDSLYRLLDNISNDIESIRDRFGC